MPLDLGDGLSLRQAISADADALGTFEGANLEPPEHPARQFAIATHTRDLVGRPHPSFAPSDFLIVEERQTGRIVSAMCLISQTWTYDGIPFGVGRPELVATAPDFRRRGLVRKQFEVIHAWSAERGELVQAITGIPNFYRQYGYEMTVNLDGGRVAYRTDVPVPKDGEPELYRIRPAMDDDVPFLAETYRLGARRSLLASVRDDALWRHDLLGRSQVSGSARLIRIVETVGGDQIGYLVVRPGLRNRRDVVLDQFDLVEGASWLEVTPVVLRYLREHGKTQAEREGLADFERIFLGLVTDHPALTVAENLLGRIQPPYSWFLRVPNLPSFIQVIRPVLEARLAASVAVGFTGMLKISRYLDGFVLRFERGRLVEVVTFRPTLEDRDVAAFPGLSFLHLLFGYRTIEELRHLFTDCQVSAGEYRVVLNALFPKKASEVWPVE